MITFQEFLTESASLSLESTEAVAKAAVKEITAICRGWKKKTGKQSAMFDIALTYENKKVGIEGWNAAGGYALLDVYLDDNYREPFKVLGPQNLSSNMKEFKDAQSKSDYLSRLKEAVKKVRKYVES